MARTKSTVIVDDISVEVFHYPIPLSLKIMTRLTKIMAPSAGAALSGDTNILDKNIDMATILSCVADKLDEDIVIDTIISMLPYVTVKGKAPKNLESFDDYGAIFMLKVVKESIMHNYSDFFVGLLEKGAEKESQEKAGQLTQSNMSTGTSGDQ